MGIDYITTFPGDIDSFLDACKIIIKGQEMVAEGEKHSREGHEEIKRGYEELTKLVGGFSSNTTDLLPAVNSNKAFRRRILKRRSPRSDDEMVNLIIKLLQKHKRGLTVNAVKARVGTNDKRIRELKDSLVYKGIIEYEYIHGKRYPVMKLMVPEKQKKSKG